MRCVREEHGAAVLGARGLIVHKHKGEAGVKRVTVPIKLLSHG